MKWLSRIIAIVFFIFFFGLALKNTQETALYFFWGYELRGPLVLIVLCFFIAGCILGLLAMTPMIFRQRRELARLRKNSLESGQKEGHETQEEPPSPPKDGISS